MTLSTYGRAEDGALIVDSDLHTDRFHPSFRKEEI